MSRPNILNLLRSCGNSVKVWWEILDRFCCKFNYLANSATIVKIGSHLTKLSPIMQCPVFLWTMVYIIITIIQMTIKFEQSLKGFNIPVKCSKNSAKT